MQVQGNIDRFNGFANEYDSARPACPEIVVELLTSYLGHRPGLVVDLGCGTGLSTLIWAKASDLVVGIDPNEGMRVIAEAKAREAGLRDISFAQGFSHETGLAPESADIVTCSQSFHWMEPMSTLAEASRVLRPAGVFAAYDCDWPPVTDWALEQEYQRLNDAVKRICTERPQLKDASSSWDKEGHLQSIISSGRFRYCREIVFHNRERCTAARFKGLAMSQGALQSLLKSGCSEVVPHIDSLAAKADESFGADAKEITLCYRMRIGVK